MTEAQIRSWIFLATAFATSIKSTDITGISSVADGINHAVPTHKELQTSISWLISKGLIVKEGKNYKLTGTGKFEFEAASKNTDQITVIWENLETRLSIYFD